MRALALAALLLGAACARAPKAAWLVMETSKGRIVARLYADKAPKTVAHLKALADGTEPWRDPRTGKTVSRPLYDGVVFHRVVPGYYVQTGDPAGTGEGDPAVPVPDEIVPGLRFDRPGLLGMASWGPGTSQTQFFITLSPQPDLDGQHTLFGEVVEGLDAAKAISRVPRDEKNGDRPLDPPVLKRLRIVDLRP